MPSEFALLRLMAMTLVSRESRHALLMPPNAVWLHRFYAWVGRKKIGWGIRARIASEFRRIGGSKLPSDLSSGDPSDGPQLKS